MGKGREVAGRAEGWSQVGMPVSLPTDRLPAPHRSVDRASPIPPHTLTDRSAVVSPILLCAQTDRSALPLTDRSRPHRSCFVPSPIDLPCPSLIGPCLTDRSQVGMLGVAEAKIRRLDLDPP